MTQQLTFDSMAVAQPTRAKRMRDAHAAADSAIDKGLARVDRDSPEWMDKALEKIRTFARNQSAGVWTIEMARCVIERELPDAGDKRVWGALTRIAVKRGYIKREKGWFFPAASSNGSPKACYSRGAEA